MNQLVVEIGPLGWLKRDFPEAVDFELWGCEKPSPS